MKKKKKKLSTWRAKKNKRYSQKKKKKREKTEVLDHLRDPGGIILRYLLDLHICAAWTPLEKDRAGNKGNK